MRRTLAPRLPLLITTLLLAGCVSPASGPAEPRWLAAWGSGQLAQDSSTAAGTPREWQAPLSDVSLRQVLRTSLAGDAVRVRVSNLFGAQPLRVGAVSVARVLPGTEGGTPQLQAGSLQALRFNGQRALELAPGTEAWSDPLPLAVPQGADLVVQMHIVQSPARATVHPGSRMRSWALAGNRADLADWSGATAHEGWWHLAAVDVQTRRSPPVLVATGDSITDGYGVPSGSYQRWTDALSRRLAALDREAAVVNTGIGGNRLLREGLGPQMLARFDRDALARSGATHVALLVGVNDLGVSHRQRATTAESRAALLAEMKAGFTALKAQARSRGICLFVGTVMPYGGSGYYQPAPENEADRQALNRWIREDAGFDAVLDFDALMRDPARPGHLRAEVDNDGLHPSLAGYRVMADAFPVDALARRCPAR